MDHIVYLDHRFKELEKLLNGTKSMIIRGGIRKRLPEGIVRHGDVLYLVNHIGEKNVSARGVVSHVLCFEKLSQEESFETIVRHQDKLQLTDKQFEKLAGKSCLVLVDLDNIEDVDPFSIDISNCSGIGDWFPVGKIEKVAIRPASPTG